MARILFVVLCLAYHRMGTERLESGSTSRWTNRANADEGGHQHAGNDVTEEARRSRAVASSRTIPMRSPHSTPPSPTRCECATPRQRPLEGRRPPNPRPQPQSARRCRSTSAQAADALQASDEGGGARRAARVPPARGFGQFPLLVARNLVECAAAAIGRADDRTQRNTQGYTGCFSSNRRNVELVERRSSTSEGDEGSRAHRFGEPCTTKNAHLAHQDAQALRSQAQGWTQMPIVQLDSHNFAAPRRYCSCAT